MVPSNHYSDATKDRAYLNYALQKGLSVNVGKIIEQSIISRLTGRVTGGLGHPSLIYQLCLRAGVSSSAAEEVHHPSPMITHKMLNTFERQPPAAGEGAADEEEGVGAADEAGPSSRPRTSRRLPRVATQTPPPPPTASTVERLERELVEVRQELQDVRSELHDARKELKREQRSMKARQDQAVKENRWQFEFMKESMQVLVALV